MSAVYLARYTLRNGTRGVLHVIAASSCAALDAMFATFPDQLAGCGVRRL